MRPVADLGPALAAVDDRGGSVVGIYDRFDEDQALVRGAEGLVQSATVLATNDQAVVSGRKVRVGPGGDVVIVGGLAEIAWPTWYPHWRASSMSS